MRERDAGTVSSSLRLPPGRTALPAALRVALAPEVHVLGGGSLLVGGAPLRAVSLTDHGREVVTGWVTPGPVGPGAARQQLAGRLLDAGMLSPLPDASAITDHLTLVVPVRDRPEQLERCLWALARAVPETPIIVVDDGSLEPLVVSPALRDRVRVIRHPRPRGAAAARNTGLSACATAFVGFVDSDVVVPPRTASRLLAHFADPLLAAVAPRVRSFAGRGPLAGYEVRHSPLDMGPRPSLVAPGRPVSYIPSAVLFVRRAAVGAGFDESLLIGEDVDLVWRASAAGWRIRYAPEAEVLHDHPTRLAGFLARRRLYASSVGILAKRHPQALPAVWLNPRGALVWMLAFGGFRRSSAGVALWTIARTERQLSKLTSSSRGLAVALTLRGLGVTGDGLGRAVRRAWSPLLFALAPRCRHARAVLAAAFAVRLLQDVMATHDLRAGFGDAPLRLADELIAAAGTWEGCVRARTLRPLLPSFRRPRGAGA